MEDSKKSFNQAITLHQNRQFLQAEKLYLEILSQHPQHADALHLLGLIQGETNRLDQGILKIQSALALKPQQAEFHNSLANLLIQKGDCIQARASLQRALQLNPRLLPAYMNLAEIQQKAGEYAEATASYQSILSLNPTHLDALNNLAILQARHGDGLQAENRWKQILQINPAYAPAYTNLGNLALELGRYQDAATWCQKALEHAPDFQEARLNLAHSLLGLKEYPDAMRQYQTILNHQCADGSLWIHQKAQIGKALSAMNACDWEAFQQTFQDIDASFPLDPFEAILFQMPMEDYLEVCKRHRHYLKAQIKHIAPFKSHPKSSDRLRIGYLSPNFNDHPVGMLIEDLFSFHDRDRYEIFAYSLRSHDDSIAKIIEKSVDHFVDLSHQTDLEAIQLIRSDRIDIFIDLDGYTQFARPKIWLARVAPVQAHWIGYPSTLGAEEMDYFLAPTTLIPPEVGSHFKEKIVELPHAWVAHRPFQDNPHRKNLTRQDFGLPEDAFVFCCFHRHYRITQPLFEIWIAVLQQIPNSVLWILSESPHSDAQLKRHAEKKGLPNRLIFASNEKMTHRWRHTLADLWLDTFLLSAGTAALLCLWSELPYVTCWGEQPQQRSAATIAHHFGMPELVALNPDDYFQKIIHYAASPAALQNLKTRISTQKRDNTLFKPQDFILDLERAFQTLIPPV